MVSFTVNGRRVETQADPAMPLLYLLRGDLALNGAKYGCGVGQCGSCAVLVDGRSTFSCLLPVAALEGREVVTLEGLGAGDKPGAVQAAFIAEQAAQCGYCIPGMIIAVEGLLRQTPSPGEPEIRAALEPHLCRCGTHARILRAALRVTTPPAGASEPGR
ncbi:(2Fe-2S)-binding protein [Aureimonas ureilytica]|uniref:(2Fe-2S)-binding protein n=1 Tax=Aureimonas ureilytica TaxID=401562 RepID=UPI00037C9848|nr:(2Fe-2S)-binding protein [Aureimonas ureilytica]